MEEVLKKLNEHDKRFDQHDEQFDITARTLADHSERLDRIENKLESVATKEDISKVLNTLDALVKVYKKNEEEIIVLAHGQKIANDRLDAAEADIRQMKPALGLS